MAWNTKISTKYLNDNRWTNEEEVFKRKGRLLDEIQNLKISLASALVYKLSKSLLGPFLKELNSEQYQDHIINENKLQILNWHLKRYNSHDTNIFKRRNAFIKDGYGILQKAVNDCGVIDLNFLTKCLRSIYLDCCFIKDIDDTLKKFKHTTVLTLCGNFIEDIAGIFLPRKLVFLELFDNFISGVDNLVRGAPKSIQHLGLGRNRLTDGSQLHLLANSNSFAGLKSMDLSDNDICSLKATLECLANLKSLTALSLEGNPCSVMPEYNKAIVQRCPNLEYLDATEILVLDKENIHNLVSGQRDPQIYFQCYRILGLPEPPKDKKNIQTIHIEVNFPLLVDASKFEETSQIEKTSQNKEKQLSNGKLKQYVKKGNEAHTKKGKNKASKITNNEVRKNKVEKAKKGRKKSYYTRENEYDANFEKQNVWYKTEKMPWSKIIQFPSVLVKHFENNSIKIRDTFRSIIPIRIVYLKVASRSTKRKMPQEKNKHGKKDKKHAANLAEVPPEGIHVETVLKRITLASFYCELKSINWSDESMDFYWADHPDIGEMALRVHGTLKILEYEINSSPKIKNPPKEKKRTDEHEPKIEYLPTVLTCQVGFSLGRL